MCDERERLIGFMYDEVDATERRRVEAHLDECPECRAEIAGLQGTRQDLLAWAVPDHEPIWRPMAPARPGPTVWQQVPVWAMAAAASAVLASGVMGGLAVRWFSPAATTSVGATVELAPAAGPVAAQAVDMAAIEARVLNQVRDEMRRELIALTARSSAPAVATPVANPSRDVALAALMRRMNDLERWRADQDEWVEQQKIVNYGFENRLGRVSTRTTALDNELVRSNLLRVSATGSGQVTR
jgi:hypothetical protein